MDKNSKIYIAGHTGMVGSAINRNLTGQGYNNLVFTPYPPFDLTDQKVVEDFFKREKPDYVFLAAARVGGIVANNKFRAQFLYENLMIQSNIIHQSYMHGVRKLLFLGSSCIYPKNCPQPIKEEYLMTGELEYTNEPYAIAKIAGLKMCESYNIQYGTNFIAVMPTNLYGPNDNYNLETSHVLPALIRKMHLGKCLENNDWESLLKDLKKNPVEGVNEKSEKNEIIRILDKYGIRKTSQNVECGTRNPEPVTITLWGTGAPFREFLHVDDVADACVYLMNHSDFPDIESLSEPSSREIRNSHINLGTGKDLTIKNLSELIKEIVGFRGQLMWDISKPDGTFRKLLDVSKINSLGWKEKVRLDQGIEMIYKKFAE
jgi:GDP-L-fucose synthase